MATARRATMMAMLVYNIVKLVILIICLQYNFYPRRLLPQGERTLRGSWAGRDAGELSRGQGGFFDTTG